MGCEKMTLSNTVQGKEAMKIYAVRLTEAGKTSVMNLTTSLYSRQLLIV